MHLRLLLDIITATTVMIQGSDPRLFPNRCLRCGEVQGKSNSLDVLRATNYWRFAENGHACRRAQAIFGLPFRRNNGRDVGLLIDVILHLLWRFS
jgi:hypothetical protein